MLEGRSLTSSAVTVSVVIAARFRACVEYRAVYIRPMQERRRDVRLGKGWDLLRLNMPKRKAALGGIPSDECHVEKVGRNQKCPCGSDRKFKRCHGWRHIRWSVTERLRGYDGPT